MNLELYNVTVTFPRTPGARKRLQQVWTVLATSEANALLVLEQEHPAARLGMEETKVEYANARAVLRFTWRIA